ncbi:hypothetical protein AVEN_11350-1 [Araneus ventricosus]|uniref:Uncharacterized protein n=1 Tax=Araneus ventricosus TaxID=182803 RepID=A0A4Y2HC89_ARAVE|nr:hypothetical protein AVEN_11350-1 [Araneus ventricosus]
MVKFLIITKLSPCIHRLQEKGENIFLDFTFRRRLSHTQNKNDTEKAEEKEQPITWTEGTRFRKRNMFHRRRGLGRCLSAKNLCGKCVPRITRDIRIKERIRQKDVDDGRGKGIIKLGAHKKDHVTRDKDLHQVRVFGWQEGVIGTRTAFDKLPLGVK